MTAALKDGQVSLRLPIDLKDKMEAYAHLTGRTKSFVAMEALSTYLEVRVPQIEDLKSAVLAADQGDFASDDEVQAVTSRYVIPSVAKGRPLSATRRRPK